MGEHIEVRLERLEAAIQSLCSKTGGHVFYQCQAYVWNWKRAGKDADPENGGLAVCLCGADKVVSEEEYNKLDRHSLITKESGY